ncbi:MAG TPA: COX15/CtaA family protein [Thermoplasmata archaeon]
MEREPLRRVDVGVRLDRRKTFQLLAIAAVAFAYGTIVLGGTVRGMGAGLACPDWPLCNGSVVPDLADPTIAVEYAHRLVAALTSLFVLLTMILALLWHRSEMRIVTLSTITFAVLAAQVAFGALTITSALDWVVVTIHLALGTATLAFALMVALLALRIPTGAAREADAEGPSSLDEEMHHADTDEADGDP